MSSSNLKTHDQKISDKKFGSRSSLKKVLLVGGGTGGHILPLRNLTDELIKRNVAVEIIGAESLLDREIFSKNFSDIPVHFLRTGKIRRYFSFRNIWDTWLIIQSIWTAGKLLKTIKPDVLFFKGGFVGFPVLLATRYLLRLKTPIFSHESDISAGVLTQFAARFSHKTFYSFGKNAYPLFYSPIHHSSFEIRNSSRTSPDQRSTENSHEIPHILIFGGSQGAQFVNTLSLQCSDKLLKKYHITLISGKNKRISLQHPHFKQFESLPFDKMAEQIQKADLIIARGGANSLFQIIHAQKPSIIIPLPSVARNHQFLNAQYFADQGLCHVLEQKNATPRTFLKVINDALHDTAMTQALQKYKLENSAGRIAEEMVK